MGSWKVKCAVDTAKAVLPFQASLRRYKDRAVGYRREPGKDRNTIRDGLLLLEWLGDVKGKTVLEVGTGWQPMIPILFALAGAQVLLTDLHELMRVDTLNAALESIYENRAEIVERMGLRPGQLDDLDRNCKDRDARLQEFNLKYLAPCDCCHLDLAVGSVDIVMSRAVLEHVPPQVIEGIFQEAHRLLRPDGRMLHLVDHADHWSFRDKSITAVNFLRYSDATFRWTCVQPQNYQNRLRHSEYAAMIVRTGFEILREERNVDAKCVAALSTMPLAERFQTFDKEDLATTDSILLAAPRPIN